MSTKQGTDPISQNDLKEYHNDHVAPYLSQGGGGSSVTVIEELSDIDEMTTFDGEAAGAKAVKSLHSAFSNALTALKNTAIAQAVGATAQDTFTSLITKLGTIVDRGGVTPSKLNVGGSYTIPAGYHDGTGVVQAETAANQGLVSPSGNKSITISSTGTTSNINVSSYATASVTTSGLSKINYLGRVTPTISNPSGKDVYPSNPTSITNRTGTFNLSNYSNYKSLSNNNFFMIVRDRVLPPSGTFQGFQVRTKCQGGANNLDSAQGSYNPGSISYNASTGVLTVQTPYIDINCTDLSTYQNNASGAMSVDVYYISNSLPTS